MALEVPPPEALPAVAARSTSLSLISLALLVVSVAFAIAGQLTLKSAMDEIGRIGRAEVRAPMDTLVRAAKEPRLWIGLVLFAVSALFWLIILSRVPLSVAYPFVGMSYVLIVLFARLVLHEHVPVMRWVGVAVVAVGIAVVGLSFTRAGRL
jgi:multidrug transporter EmrE-like cation transporter